MKNLTNKLRSLLILFTFAAFFTSCGDDDSSEPIEPPFASFNFSINETNTLMVSFENTSIDGDSYLWDFGDGSGTSTDESPTHTYTASGTFTVTLTVTNAGGEDDATTSVTVSGFGNNLITNGDMETTGSWTELPIWTGDDNGVDHRIVDGVFRFQNGDDGAGGRFQWSNYAIYQEVQLEAGKTYVFDADLSSTSGTLATWFEIYLVAGEPLADESNFGEMQFGIKSFGEGENCSATPFSGTIMEIAALCTANSFDKLMDVNGQFTVTASDLSSTGTVFLLFKAGSGFAPEGEIAGFNDGIDLDNVEIKEVL